MMTAIFQMLFFAVLVGIIAWKIGAWDPDPRRIPPLPQKADTPNQATIAERIIEALEQEIPGSTRPARVERPDHIYIVAENGNFFWIAYNRDGALANLPNMPPYGSC